MKTKHPTSDLKTRPELDIVLKCDSIGSVEAVTASISEITTPGVDINVIHSAVGSIAKSDLLLAETASGLIVGFQVDVLPGMEKALREHHVEVRIYSVIYSLTTDIKSIAESIAPAVSAEQIIGSARVIALFKGSRRGIIIGCEVSEGHLALGQHFRIISAMGPVYSGIIKSLHIGEIAVQKAMPGQQVGIKIEDFKKVKTGDIVESLRPLPKGARPWQPTGEIIRK